MSGIISEYLGADIAANRPATPTLTTGACGVFVATDTGDVSIWDGTVWADVGGGTDPSAVNALIDAWAAARTVTAGVGLTGGGDLSTDITLDLADTAVTPDFYGSTTTVPVVTVDQQGRITDIFEESIDFPPSQPTLDVADEGVSVAVPVGLMNFVGAGVTVTSPSAGEVEVDIPGGGSGIPSGTSFPGSPSNGDRFYRTDLQAGWFYSSSASRWLSEQVYTAGFDNRNVVADTNVYMYPPRFVDYDLYLLKLEAALYISTAAQWNLNLFATSITDSSTLIASFVGSGLIALQWNSANVTINALMLKSTERCLRVQLDEVTGTAGIDANVAVSYRLAA